MKKGNEKSFPFTIFLIRFWFDNFLPICNRCICTVFRDRFVSRADDLVYVDELLNTVGAPAGDTGDCEHRCKEFFRQIKHGVYETAVEIDIRAYTFIDLALVCDDFLRNLSDIHIKLIFFSLCFSSDSFPTKVWNTFARGSEMEYTACPIP